jgi:hypothetical protein
MNYHVLWFGTTLTTEIFFSFQTGIPIQERAFDPSNNMRLVNLANGQLTNAISGGGSSSAGISRNGKKY